MPVAVLFQSADVEHRMNLQLGRKVEFVGIIVDHAFNCEWSEVFEGKFGRSFVGAEHLEVLRGQQHLVADCKGDCAAVLIGVVRLALLSFDVRAWARARERGPTACDEYAKPPRDYSADEARRWPGPKATAPPGRS